jgi:hypothetical protein
VVTPEFVASLRLRCAEIVFQNVSAAEKEKFEITAEKLFNFIWDKVPILQEGYNTSKIENPEKEQPKKKK